jgi:competence protein ComFB
MDKYHNVMETLVIEKLDEIWATLDCCKCERCRNDIIAYALNQMMPKYVVTEEGALYARVSTLSAEYELEIIKAIANALRMVSEHPNHTLTY